MFSCDFWEISQNTFFMVVDLAALHNKKFSHAPFPWLLAYSPTFGSHPRVLVSLFPPADFLNILTLLTEGKIIILFKFTYLSF